LAAQAVEIIVSFLKPLSVGKKKLQHFAENKTFAHFFQPNYDELNAGFALKGNWSKVFFKNPNPIVVELGCGKGEFTVGLAQQYPEKNFIGMDLKGARMWRGAKTTHEKKIPNIAFVRGRIENIGYIFSPDEVSEIWITFPDPQPKKSDIKRRLTSPVFLERYRQIAGPDTIVHLKTDNTPLFEYTLDVIAQEQLNLLFHTFDVDENPGSNDVVAIRTFYEEMFRELGEKIKYLRFELKTH
jgi:tRNA (guanine-N7-)-methyltransferase